MEYTINKYHNAIIVDFDNRSVGVVKDKERDAMIISFKRPLDEGETLEETTCLSEIKDGVRQTFVGTSKEAFLALKIAVDEYLMTFQK